MPLTNSYTFSGTGNWSLDGAKGTNGTVQAVVPIGSTIEKAFLYATTNGNLVVSAANLGGTSVNGFSALGLTGGSSFLQAYRADVTGLVTTLIGAGSATGYNFTVSGIGGSSLDGFVLAIVYSNPLESFRTISFLDGASNTEGDQFSVNFASDIDPEAAGFQAMMSLGIGFSAGTGSGQVSTVDVNDTRLSSIAGGFDDGALANGSLITVGGLGDSIANPGSTDDELYDLRPYLADTTSVTVKTRNATNDDNIFFAGINVTGIAGISVGPNAPPLIVTQDLAGAATEESTPSGELGDSGIITFSDADLTDVHTVSAAPVGTPLGTLAVVKDSDTTGTISGGQLTWTYAVDAAAVEYLSAGQAKVENFTVSVDDQNGGIASRNVAVTITGTNDPVEILSSSDSHGFVSELPDNSPGENATMLSDSGRIDFADRDLADLHVATAMAQGPDYLGSFSLGSVDQDGNSVGWTFSVSDAALGSLGRGDMLTQYYDVTIADGQGGSAVRTVVIDLAGINDAAILSSANEIVEQGAVPATASGMLTITDEDSGEAFFQPQDDSQGRYGDLDLAADGSWSYTADAVYNLGAGQFLSDVFTILAIDGTPTTIAVTITGRDAPSAARDDLFTTDEASPIGPGLSLFADNGSGADSDDDTAPRIAAVNGGAGNVGSALRLASGALVVVNADGSFAYDPDNAFDGLTAATGAANSFGNDSFTYTLANGGTATAFFNIVGLESPGDIILGSGRDDVITGLDGDDSFMLDQAGRDTAYGKSGNDGFYFGDTFTADDKVDGGDGTDTLALQGNTAVTLGDVANVETLSLESGSNSRFGDTAGNRYDYTIATRDSNVAAGETLTVIATGLLPGEDLRFDGSAESDGNFRIFAGQGVDSLTGGAGSDGFFFGADGNFTGADRIDGGGGFDSLALRGNYTGPNAAVFQDGSIANVEVVALLSGLGNSFSGQIDAAGFDYDVTLADGNFAAGALLDINATDLRPGESLNFDGSRESDGRLRILSGAGDDDIIGGGQADTLYGGLGADRIEGGAGGDIYFYRSAAESTSTGYDSLVGFDALEDRIDVPGGGSRAVTGSGSGSLSTASFDEDLAAGMDGVLGAGQAALFTASSGSLAGHVFAIVDANGVAGYQAGEDFVFDMIDPIRPLDTGTGFIV